MEKMKTKFIIAVTGRLAAAEETTAKVELIEELSDNLYSRWQDLVGSGVPEEEAFSQAMEDLGSVEELLAYLESLGPEGELPRQEGSVRDFTGDLLRGMEDIVRETVSQTKDAVDQAAIIVRNVAEKIKEKYPDGLQGKIYVHVDRDGYEEPGEEPRPEGGDKEEKGWSFAAGYDRERGFFCGTSSSRRVAESAIPSQGIKGLDVQVTNGDVTIHLDEDPEGDVRVDGDAERLDVRLSEDGVLSVRQGNTASSSFFFLRGLAAADVELTLPRRYWDFLQLSTVNGDVELDEGLEAGRLSIKATSGDIRFTQVNCERIVFKSASGDLEGSGIMGSIHAETSSGDVRLEGAMGAVRTGTSSGDIDITGSVQELRCISASGDVQVRTTVVPQRLEVSSKSGDCEIYMPGGEGFVLQFSTVSGDLDTDFPLVGPVGARSGEAIHLDGGGRTFHITSVSGDISLRQS